MKKEAERLERRQKKEAEMVKTRGKAVCNSTKSTKHRTEKTGKKK